MVRLSKLGRHRRRQAGALAACLGGAAILTPAVARVPPSALLAGLDRGAWDVRFRDGSPSRRLCVRGGYELVQLRHLESGCNPFVVEETAAKVTVQYTCRGDDYGRTTIRRETGRLVQIDTQGIVHGRPFQVTAEARRVGPCR